MNLLPVQNLDALEKIIEQHFSKETLTNNYILAKDYQDYISDNKLFYTAENGNLFLFLRKEGFYRLYYLVNNTEIKHEFPKDEKFVLEIIYRGEKHFPNNHVDFWKTNGFKPHLTRDCYFLKASEAKTESKTQPGIIIKPVKDLDDLLFAKKLIDEYLDVYTGDRLTLPEIEKYAAEGQMYCAFKEGVPCGMLQAELKNNVFWLGHIVVHEEFRGLGLASKLVDFYLDEGKKFNAQQYQLWVINDNIPAINLYKNRGFVYLNKSTTSMLKID